MDDAGKRLMVGTDGGVKKLQHNQALKLTRGTLAQIPLLV